MLRCVVGRAWEIRVGQKRCSGDHAYAKRELGAGFQRLECGNCGSVFIDLDAAGDGPTVVTVPGLFKPAKPTIFSVLREEQDNEQDEATPRAAAPRHGFGGALRLR